MTEHTIFYYPYASFKGEQELFLKAAALYFDKLYILDSEKANWAEIGLSPLSYNLELIVHEKILVRIALEDVLQRYEKIIAEFIHSDLEDPEFLKHCEQLGQAGPWNKEFAKELDVDVIRRIQGIMEENKKARDSWFKTGRGKKALKLAGLTAGAASATISLVLSATPLMPVVVATGILGLLGGSVIPGAELALDWKNGRDEAMGNGLHYLMKIKGR